MDILRRAPFAVGAFLALSGEQIELHHLLQDEPEPSPAARALIGRVIDQHHVERDAFLSVLRVYKEETVRLTNEVAETRSELSGQIEAARLEREHLVGEFLDRVDHLVLQALDVFGSRYEAELAEEGRADRGRENNASRSTPVSAADAQSVVDDIRRSSSWRVTAPFGCSPGCSPKGRVDTRAARELARTAHWSLSSIPSPTTSRSSSSTTTRRRTTVECLDALAAARSELIREIIVVDNGSDPEELSILHQRHTQGDFVLVEVGLNRFFGEGQQHRGRLRTR